MGMPVAWHSLIIQYYDEVCGGGGPQDSRLASPHQ